MIVAFSGKRGVGKTLAASYLERVHGFTKVSFAGELKRMAGEMFQFDADDWKPENKERAYRHYDWTPREFLIKLGGFMRYWDAEYWMKRVDLTHANVVIDDLRFKNEAEWLTDKGAQLVRINRYPKDVPYKHALMDQSEVDLDDWKFEHIIHEFQNTGKPVLFDALDTMLEVLKSEA